MKYKRKRVHKIAILIALFGAVIPWTWASKDPSPGMIVKEIRISGLSHTREETVLREMVSRVGEEYLDEKRAEDFQRLDRLRIFSSIKIEPLLESDGVVLNVTVKEVTPYLPYIGIDVSDENGLSLGPGVKAFNVRGKAITMSAGARFGGADQVEFALEDPWVTGNHLSYSVGYHFRDRFNKIGQFQENSHEFELSLRSYLREKGRIGGRFSLLGLSSDTPGTTLAGGSCDLVPTVAMFVGYEDRDSWTNPHRGWFSEFEIARSGGFLGGASDFWTLTVDLRRWQGFGERHSVGLYSLASLRNGKLGKEIPAYLEFQLGGGNTVRGWDQGSGRGKNQFINTIEYQYDLLPIRPLGFKGLSFYFGIGLAAFADLGVAWGESEDSDVLDGYGIGLRLLNPFVEVIRIDFAFGQPGDGLHSHFGIPWKADKQRRRVR